MIRVLLVDDEKLARVEMKKLLASQPDIEIVGEASDAEKAIELSKSLSPEIIFLDVQMPGRSGLEVAGELTGPRTQVVFVTAHDEFAIRAFELNALDYLLKPVDPKRLLQTLGRIREENPLESVRDGQLKEDDSIFLKGQERGWFIQISSIRLLQTEGNYTRLYFEQEKPLIGKPLNVLEKRLPGKIFFRANRSQILNVKRIASTQDWFSGCIKARLADGTEVEFSRRQSQLFRDNFTL